MTDREKLIELIRHEVVPYFAERIADHLLANGVTFVTDNNDGCKRIEELEAQLAEREKVVIQLRKQWQDAELHICTMCGHFNHKTDGNIVYGNRTCGEISGYPFCAAKFSLKMSLPEPPTRENT